MSTRSVILIVVAAMTALAVAVGGGIWAFLSLTSDTRETAKAFVINLSSGAYEEARAAMHPSLLAEVSAEDAREMMNGAEAYQTVRFSSIEAVNSRTTLTGTATTATDCVSEVELQLLENKVTSFSITPLCPKP